MNTKHRLSDFSSLSVICALDKFISAVETMNDTVMIPSRLLNVEPPQNSESVPVLLRGNSDPYTFYTILNNIKTSLLWGTAAGDDDPSEGDKPPNEGSSWCMAKEATKEVKGHVRRISSVSTASVVSSEPECERLSDAGDSGVESEETQLEPLAEVTSSLKTHLSGLQGCLTRLTETAVYITRRYQEEVIA